MAPFRTLCGAAASVAIVTMASAAVISAANQVQALAQQYPDKPVTIISDSAAGSTPDAVLRVIADRLGQIWGQQVMAVNHPGATGSIASRIAAEAPRDGYTLYMPALSTFVALPGLAPNVPVQLPRDFTAIGFAAENPMFIVAAPSLGIASPGGADRHSRKNNRQSERRSAQGRHGSRSQEDDRHARQRYASDVTG